MSKSMTGFGRAHDVIDEREILVEIKSVNHRYFEFSSRITRVYSFLEPKIKQLIQQNTSRGKVEVTVSISHPKADPANIMLNEEVVEGYVKALRGVTNKFFLSDDLSLTAISKFPDVFTPVKKIEDEDEVFELLSPVFEKAMKAFLSSRENEGQRLKEDILLKLDDIGIIVGQIEEAMPLIVTAYKERLYAKINELLEDKQIEDSRVLTEVGIFADKVSIDEETVRLKSHLEEFKSLLGEDKAIGRKCDFLIQEINREINTIGSKASDLEVSKKVIDLKSIVEKIREQIQNIE